MNDGPITACRVDLGKRSAQYLVIADDGQVLHVERDPGEQRFQELADDCLGSEPLSLLTYTAVSHGHAAVLAHQEHAATMAAHRMAEVIDRHLKNGAQGWVAGWIAIRIADGTSDGELYVDAEDAGRGQEHPERCLIFPISPYRPWTVEACADALAAAVRQRGLHHAPVRREHA